jgi:hypothetical protein
MLGVRCALSISLLAIFLSIASSRTETPEKEVFLQRNTPTDQGAGARVEYRLRSSFEFSDWVVAAVGQTRFLVIAADAQHPLLRFGGEAVAQTAEDPSKIPIDKSKESMQKTPGVKANTPESRSKASPSAKSATPVDTSQEQQGAAGRSPSILQMLEGHETELMIATAIAATFFLIGWICGGHYYLRRDRRRRTRIRF